MFALLSVKPLTPRTLVREGVPVADRAEVDLDKLSSIQDAGVVVSVCSCEGMLCGGSNLPSRPGFNKRGVPKGLLACTCKRNFEKMDCEHVLAVELFNGWITVPREFDVRVVGPAPRVPGRPEEAHPGEVGLGFHEALGKGRGGQLP